MACGLASAQAIIAPVDVPATTSTIEAIARPVRRSISASTSAGISPRMPPPSMASAFMAAKLASRPVLAERAGQQFARWRLAALPPRLRRNGLDYYYLSVWPGLEQLAPLAELPPRRAPVHHGYVHLPFCSGLCDFCSYFVLVGRDRADMRRYVDDLLVDLALNQ